MSAARSTADASVPHRLPCNTVPVYYAGGAGIDRFRGERTATGPEDWVGSLTAFPAFLLPDGADPETGVSRLADGSSLRELVRADPEAWLGAQLAAAFGDEPGLLVKLLDAGERLPVHCHPSRPAARARLRSRFGKTEGWIVIAAAPGAAIWLGFSRLVRPDELRAWVEAQDVDAMLAALNRLEVAPGDVYYLPAGLPHAIGAGVTIVELQEPTSFSILAEYARFGLDEEQATLGLGWDDALACFDLGAHDAGALGELAPVPETIEAGPGWTVERLFPAAASEFFQAHRVRLTREAPLRAGPWRMLVVERGEGALASASGTVPLSAGETWLLPAALGDSTLDGDLGLLVCLPPDEPTRPGAPTGYSRPGP